MINRTKGDFLPSRRCYLGSDLYRFVKVPGLVEWISIWTKLCFLAWEDWRSRGMTVQKHVQSSAPQISETVVSLEIFHQHETHLLLTRMYLMFARNISHFMFTRNIFHLILQKYLSFDVLCLQEIHETFYIWSVMFARRKSH